MVKNSFLVIGLIIFSLSLNAQTELKLYNSQDDLWSAKSNLSDTAYLPDIYRSPLHKSNAQLKGIKQYQNKFARYFRNRHFFEMHDSTIDISADPYIDFGYSEQSDTSYTQNSRGLVFKGRLSENFYFISGAVENQGYYPKYLRDYYKSKYVLSGFGRFKNFKEGGFDYSYAFGQIYWAPKPYLTIEAGQGKNFIGQGYRSLIMSDFNAFYPFLKISTRIKKLQFSHMYTAFQDVYKDDSRLLVYQRSHGTFTSVGINLPYRIHLSLTEAIIWRTTTASNNNVFPLSFFNPIPFYRVFQYGLNNDHNVLLGMDLSWNPIKSIILYSQVIVDDLSSLHKTDSLNIYNRYGFQTGIRVVEPFKVKNLFLLAEYNRVLPFTYTHSVRRQSFTGMNEALAHPLGANFNEIILQLHYQFKSAYISLKYSSAKTGKDYATTNFGSNLSLSDTTASTTNPLFSANYPGIVTEITNFQGEIGYIINPRYNFILAGGIHWRNEEQTLETKNIQLLYIKLSTQIINNYKDF